MQKQKCPLAGLRAARGGIFLYTRRQGVIKPALVVFRHRRVSFAARFRPPATLRMFYYELVCFWGCIRYLAGNAD